ncbi:hypothetical protein Tco_0128165 [Tanacetum coccineum]
MGLWYPKDTGFELTAFSDSDHAGCLDSRKSTSGGIQFLGGDKLVSWSSKKQDCTSMSSAEAEYVSLSACASQVLLFITQLTDYGFHFDKIPMYCDSKAAIAISCNPVQHSHTKHIDVRYHFIKEQVEKGIVELFFVGTEYQLADLFTKALSEDRFKYLVRRLGGDKLVSWSSKKQDCTSMSSAEAEYVLPHSHLVNPGQHSIPKTYDVRFSLHKKQVEKWYCRIILCRTDNTMLADLFTKALSEDRSYALSWKPCQGDSLNLPDHRAQVDQGSQIKMIQVKEMMHDNDLKNSKSKDKGSKSRSQSMDEQSHYKQDKTITRQSINVKRHIFNVIGDTEKFEERDLNIGGDSGSSDTEDPYSVQAPSGGVTDWNSTYGQAILIDPGRLFPLVDLTATFNGTRKLLTARKELDLYQLHRLASRHASPRDSSERTRAFIFTSAGPSRKKCRSRLIGFSLSSLVTGSLALPVLISYHLVREGMRLTQCWDTAEVRYRPMTALIVKEEIAESAREDSSDSLALGWYWIVGVEDCSETVGEFRQNCRDFMMMLEGDLGGWSSYLERRFGLRP